jgi:phage shock protein PspC (stress-responsive transcriptional regulator)
MLGGVCGGLGAYLNVDPTLIRVVVVVVGVFSGFGVPLYFALWLFLPLEERSSDQTMAERIREGADEIADRAREIADDFGRSTSHPGRGTTIAIAATLIVLGLVFLLRNLGFAWMRWLSPGTLWPAIPIVVGLVLLWRWWKEDRSE